MNETPVASTPFIETPAFDSNAFVAHWENEAFLKGKRTTPYLPDDSTLVGIIFAIATFIFGGIGTVVLIGGSNQAFSIITGLLLIMGAMGGFVAMIRSTNPARQARKMKGQVVMGEVVESEKIRIEGGFEAQEKIALYYQFTNAEGKIVRRRVETATASPRMKMAPAPGTPVYLWRDSEGYYTLL